MSGEDSGGGLYSGNFLGGGFDCGDRLRLRSGGGSTGEEGGMDESPCCSAADVKDCHQFLFRNGIDTVEAADYYQIVAPCIHLSI